MKTIFPFYIPLGGFLRRTTIALIIKIGTRKKVIQYMDKHISELKQEYFKVSQTKRVLLLCLAPGVLHR